MKKKGLPLVLGMILLILLVVLYIGLVKHNGKTSEESEETLKVLDLAAEDIISVRIELDETEETFTIQDDIWSLESDAAFQVDSSTVNTLISTFVQLTASRILENVSDLEQYGLEQPVHSVVLTDKNGNTYTVCFGDCNSVTGEQYVSVTEESGRVYTVDASVSSSISTVLEDYRVEEETVEDTEVQESTESLE